MNSQPKTAEAFLALPVAGFRTKVMEHQGHTITVPVAPNLVAFSCEDDTVLTCDGWTLARYADGTWCRK